MVWKLNCTDENFVSFQIFWNLNEKMNQFRKFYIAICIKIYIKNVKANEFFRKDHLEHRPFTISGTNGTSAIIVIKRTMFIYKSKGIKKWWSRNCLQFRYSFFSGLKIEGCRYSPWVCGLSTKIFEERCQLGCIWCGYVFEKKDQRED